MPTVEATEDGQEREIMTITQTQVAAGASSLLAPTAVFPWPSAPINVPKLQSYLNICVARGIGYGLGAKATNLTAIPPDYHEIDCSGWVRAAVAVATAGKTIMPDGSVTQHDWCDRMGLKVSSRGALLLLDDLTRIAFIAPCPAHPVGHVYLTRNTRTLESWGGHGPGSRSVLTHLTLGILQQLTTEVYVLGAY